MGEMSQVSSLALSLPLRRPEAINLRATVDDQAMCNGFPAHSWLPLGTSRRKRNRILEGPLVTPEEALWKECGPRPSPVTEHVPNTCGAARAERPGKQFVMYRRSTHQPPHHPGAWLFTCAMPLHLCESVTEPCLNASYQVHEASFQGPSLEGGKSPLAEQV
jgi:hypothetical protein|uniref:Uncharacterized protein n=1 Tax=Bionectria ochroleuca TaxID=29856 RepID=A0A8H7N7W4_BIOOC